MSEPRNFFEHPIKENDSYYDIFGITSDASKGDINKAYRVLSLKYHPDKHYIEGGKPGPNSQKASDIFTKLNEIYQCLSDDKKRAQYNLSQATKGFDKNLNPEILLKKEDWIGFERFARKVLFALNPLKQYIFIGARKTIPFFDLPESIEFQIGISRRKYMGSELTTEEKEDFKNFVLLFQNQRKTTGFTSSVYLEPRYSLDLSGNDNVLIYKDKGVVEIARLAKEQDAAISQLLGEYTDFLNHKTYFNKKIKDLSSDIIVESNFGKDKNSSQKELYFTLSIKKNFHKNPSAEEQKKIWEDFKDKFKSEFSISIEEDPSLLKPRFKVSYQSLLSSLKKDSDEVMKAVKVQEKKKLAEHYIEAIKLYLECKDYEAFEKEVEQLKAEGLSFSYLEEITTENQQESPLMCAVNHRAPLNVIEKLVELGSNLHYEILESGIKSTMIHQAIVNSEPQVVAFICEKIGPLDKTHSDYWQQVSTLESMQLLKQCDQKKSYTQIMLSKIFVSVNPVVSPSLGNSNQKENFNSVQPTINNRNQFFVNDSEKEKGKEKSAGDKKEVIQTNNLTRVMEILKDKDTSFSQKKSYLVSHFGASDEQKILSDLLDIMLMVESKNPNLKPEKVSLSMVLSKLDTLFLTLKKKSSTLNANQKELLGFASEGLKEIKDQQQVNFKLTLWGSLSLVIVASILVSLAVVGLSPLFIGVAAGIAGVLCLMPAVPSVYNNARIGKRLTDIENILVSEAAEPPASASMNMG